MGLRPIMKVAIIVIAWLAVLDMSVIAKREIARRMPRAEKPTPSFTFATPSAEEAVAMREGRLPNEYVSLPLAKETRVFACPGTTCKTLGTLPIGSEVRLNLALETDWIPVSWKGPADASTTPGYVSAGDLAGNYAPPPPPPDAMLDPIEAGTDDANTKPAEPVPIDPQTVVGIVCQFDKDEDGVTDKRMTRGSGAIVTNDGYIITARSVVDLNYLNEGLESYALTGCFVGQLPKSEPLPSIEAIRKVNAFVRIPYLAYKAELAFIPPPNDMSEYEKAWLDFAVLKISGVNTDARWFGGPTALPEEFPAAPLLISELPKIGESTLNFSFPSGTSIGFGTDVHTLFMQGLISHVTGYWAGDGHYADDLFLIENHMDTEDTAGGRFGSPIFWKGYVVGIHTAKQQGSRQIYNLGAKTALDSMVNAGFVIPLSVQ